MVKVKKAFGGISAQASHINTGNGDPLNFPSIDDTANTSAIAAINAAPGSAGADLVFGQVAFSAFKYAATGTGQLGLKVPRELVDDSLFDITSLVTEMLGIRLARKMAADYATGVGTTAPSGLMNRTGVTVPPSVATTGLVQATANAQLQAFIHLLDPAYVNESCVWIMNWADARHHRRLRGHDHSPLDDPLRLVRAWFTPRLLAARLPGRDRPGPRSLLPDLCRQPRRRQHRLRRVWRHR